MLAVVLTVSMLMAVVVLIAWTCGAPDAWQMMAAVLTPAGATIGFYLWKAKAENLVKYAKKIDKDSLREVIAEMAKERMSSGDQSYIGY